MANTYNAVLGTVIKPEKIGRSYRAVASDGTVIAGVENYALRNAYRSKNALKLVQTKAGNLQWHKVPLGDWRSSLTGELFMGKSAYAALTHDQLVDTVRNAHTLKPSGLKMSELKWRYIVRSALVGDNLMFLGPSGCGKTMSVYAVAEVLNRPFFYFNMGATQDPRGALIGNTHFNPAEGTYVAESEFITAIQTPNAIILLDEMSRAHPDASNILMTVLDKAQRYLRLDEKPNSPKVSVHPSVSFFLTANVGSEYTGTRIMDRALFDRCKLVEIDPLDAGTEMELLKERYPAVPAEMVRAIAQIAAKTREDVKSENPKVDTIISTRMTLEMAGLLHDGFTLEEAAEICIYPFFTEAGGAESPRSYVRKIVQQNLPIAGKTNSGDPTIAPSPDDDERPW